MTKPIIQARQFAEDIRSGMSDSELMGKYKLSAKGLQSAFTKLLNNGIVTVEELYGGRPRSGADTVIIDDPRRAPRHYLSVSVSIYDPNFPAQKGKLHDITERGIGVRGLFGRPRLNGCHWIAVPRSGLGFDSRRGKWYSISDSI
jgi:hypothetical protein